MRAGVHFFLSALVIFCVGSGMHFVFAASGCSSLVGVFAAVNESVWEHAKLMLWPMIAWWLCLCEGSVQAAVVSTYSAAVLLFAIYAVVSEVAHYEQLWFDIVLFAFFVASGQAVGVYAFERRLPGSEEAYTVALAVMLTCMCVFTFAWVPAVPYLFLDHARQVYGPYCAASSSNVSSVFG